MSKHNDKEFNETIKANIRKALKEQYDFGIAQGMYAACKVIYDKVAVENPDYTTENRLNDIIALCKPIIDMVNEEKARKTGD